MSLYNSGNPFLHTLSPIDRLENKGISIPNMNNFKFIGKPHAKYTNQLRNNCLLKESSLCIEDQHLKSIIDYKTPK